MKKSILVLSLAFACAAFTISNSVIAADATTSTTVSVSNYVSLSKLIMEAEKDINVAKETVSKMVASVLAKASNASDRLALMSEVATTVFASTEDWSKENRATLASVTVESALAFAESKNLSEGEKVKLVQQIVATVYAVCTSASGIPSAPVIKGVKAAIPADYTPFIEDMEAAPLQLIGVKQSLHCKEIYKEIRKVAGDVEDEKTSALVITTTTSTTSTTTTSTIPPALRPDVPVVPPVTPTTKPSPTPVGMR